MPRPSWNLSSRQQRWLTALLAAAVGLGFLLGVLREAFICDDAFISFRYARHLVDGLGLVWNVGERVEGYTNFLWVLILAAGMRLGAAPELLAPILGTFCGGGVLALLAWLGARDHGWRDPLIWLAPAVLSVHSSFLAWSTGGLETQLFSLLVFGGMAACLAERRRGATWPWRAPALLALATLTRPEGALFAATAGGVWALDVLRRRRGWRPLVGWAAVYALPVATHALWRRLYYGDWLPNTFYAKVSGFRWEDGTRYLAFFATCYQLHVLLLLALLAVVVRRGFREGLFATVLAVDLLYLASVGGDTMEFRFLVPLLPYLYWLMADGVRVLREWASAPQRRIWAPAAAALAAGVLLVGTAISPMRWIDPPRGLGSVDSARTYATFRAQQGRILQGLIESGALPPDLRIATGGIGALPYYTDWFVIDHHGLTDRFVARQQPTDDYLGHEKNVPVSYLAEREVAVVMLSQVLVVPSSARLGSILATSKAWLDVYNNRDDPDPAFHLRPRCVKVAPGWLMFYGTNLDERSEQRILGHLPSCPVPPPLSPTAPDAG